jgi:hypothetical protein
MTSPLGFRTGVSTAVVMAQGVVKLKVHDIVGFTAVLSLAFP